jgi:hypothetical protein
MRVPQLSFVMFYITERTEKISFAEIFSHHNPFQRGGEYAHRLWDEIGFPPLIETGGHLSPSYM